MRYIGNIAIPECINAHNGTNSVGCMCEHLVFVGFDFLDGWGKYGYMTSPRHDLWKYTETKQYSSNEYVDNLLRFQADGHLPIGVSVDVGRGLLYDKIEVNGTSISFEIDEYGKGSKVCMTCRASDFAKNIDTLGLDKKHVTKFLKRLRLHPNTLKSDQGKINFITKILTQQ